MPPGFEGYTGEDHFGYANGGSYAEAGLGFRRPGSKAETWKVGDSFVNFIIGFRPEEEAAYSAHWKERANVALSSLLFFCTHI